MPLISIIVPVYNVEKYLRSCLDSIRVQTFKDFEAVLVDDGSTDNSGFICDEYEQKDNRFVVVHKQNEGVAKARITAFEHSEGEYITFIDADDYVSPVYLEKLTSPIIEEGVDMVSCNFFDIDSQIISICLNDTANCPDEEYEEINNKLQILLGKKFNTKSSFEI